MVNLNQYYSITRSYHEDRMSLFIIFISFILFLRLKRRVDAFVHEQKSRLKRKQSGGCYLVARKMRIDDWFRDSLSDASMLKKEMS